MSVKLAVGHFGFKGPASSAHDHRSLMVCTAVSVPLLPAASIVLLPAVSLAFSAVSLSSGAVVSVPAHGTH